MLWPFLHKSCLLTNKLISLQENKSGHARVGTYTKLYNLCLLGYYRPDIPFLIFGVATLIGGFSAYLLPETRGKKLPDTVQEALAMVDDENATRKN